MTFRSINEPLRRQVYDQTTWSSRGRELYEFNTTKSGSLVTPQIIFAYVYEHSPYFTFGVELLDGTIDASSVPIVSAGVGSWQTRDMPEGGILYLGCVLWAAVSSDVDYPLRWRFSFEGQVYRNRSLIS